MKRQLTTAWRSAFSGAVRQKDLRGLCGLLLKSSFGLIEKKDCTEDLKGHKGRINCRDAVRARKRSVPALPLLICTSF